MKQSMFFFFLLCIASILNAQSVGIGTETPDASAAMDISSTTQGMLIPRMNTAQREMISSPAAGLLVYDITTNTFWFRDNTAWTELVAGGETEVHRNGPDMIYMGMTDSVGIGTQTPQFKLQVKTGTNQYGISHTNGDVDLASWISGSGGEIGTKSNHPFKLFSNDGLNQFVLMPNGNVGLGLSSSDFPLSFAATTGDKISFVGGLNGNHYGIGVAPSLLQIHTAVSNSDIGFGYGSSTSFTELMRIKGNGNVGIGISQPLNKLDIVLGQRTGADHPEGLALYLTAPMSPMSTGVEFRHHNGGAGIGFGLNGIFAVGNGVSGDLKFHAKGPDGMLGFHTAGAERVRIMENGNVGIDVFPTNKVDIHSGTPRTGEHGSGLPLYITGDIGSATNGFEIRHNNSFEGIGLGYNTVYATGYSANQTLGLASRGTGSLLFTTNNITRAWITGEGRMGIGVSDPQATLVVARGSAAEGTAQFIGTQASSHFNFSTEESTFIRGGKFGSHVLLNDLGGLGNVGIGTNNPVQKLHVAGKAYIRDSIGIGISPPHAQLQLSSTTGNRKMVMYEVANNDHQFFGFGINADGAMRYQTPLDVNDHVFYSGASTAASNELFRIKGNGNVGIGVAPTNLLDVQLGTTRSGTHPVNLPFYVTGDIGADTMGVEISHNNGTQGIGIGYNTIYASGSVTNQDIQLAAKGAGGNVRFKTNDIERMRIEAGGNVNVAGSLEIGYVRVQTPFTNFNGLSELLLTCDCPVGTVVVSGGHILNDSGIDVIASYPNTYTSWLVKVYNTNLDVRQLSVLAICARLAN